MMSERVEIELGETRDGKVLSVSFKTPVADTPQNRAILGGALTRLHPVFAPLAAKMDREAGQ